MTSRSFVKDQISSTSHDSSDDRANSSESHTFISSVSDKNPHFSTGLLRGVRTANSWFCNALRLGGCKNDSVIRKIAGFIKYIYSPIILFYRFSTNIIPADMAIHVFTGILVTVGTLTLFFSPSFRSKLSEMRERPDSLQNGILDSMAWSSDKYAVVVDNSSANSCAERYFRCEYYWATDTDDALNTENTAYCSAYVCKGMTVTVTVVPKSCSQSNRVGIGAILKEIYAKPVYSCANSGCGDCSTLRYHSLEDGVVSFLQGCNGDASCFGQVEVSLAKESAATAVTLKQWGPAPWGGFRGGQYSQGVARISSPAAGPSLMFETTAGAFTSSPAISSTRIAYIGSDDKYLYAYTSKEDSVLVWRFLTDGKIRSSPALSPDERTVYVGSDDHYFYAVDTATGTLVWRYLTGGAISSSPTLGIDTSAAHSYDKLDTPGVLYVGSDDGNLYAITTAGLLKWRFSTAILTGDVAASGAIKSSPCVSPDDAVVYFGCDNSILYAVSKSGVLKWHFRTNGAITSSPTISSDGLTLYFGSDDMHLYALSNTGILKWRYYADSPIHSSSSLFEGDIYFSTMVRKEKPAAVPSPVKGKKTVKATKRQMGNRRSKRRLAAEVQEESKGEGEAKGKGGDLTSSSSGGGGKGVSEGKGGLRKGGRVLAIVPVIAPSVVPSPSVPPPKYEGGGLFAITTQGELLWRLPIPKGSISSPLFSADGSIFIGAEDSYLYRVDSTGALKWKYDASGPISASPGIDLDGAIYVGTSTPKGRFIVIGAATETPPEAEVEKKEYSPELLSWTCSAESYDKGKTHGPSADRICAADSHANNPHLSCLPGMTEFIGKGVDITLQRDDPKFITTRLFDLRNIERVQQLHGVDHLAPPTSLLSVTALDDTEVSNSMHSGVFRGVREYTHRQATSFGVSSDFIVGTIPLGTVESVLSNSTGTWTTEENPTLARKVSTNAINGKGTLLNVATYSHTQYDLLPQPVTGQSCTPQFAKDSDQLEDDYQEDSYLSYVKRFGTHVIVGVTLGGSIAASTPYEPCAAVRVGKYSTPLEVFESYRKDMGDFTVYGKQSEISFLGQVTHRSAMTVCGGDQMEFFRDPKTPFDSWTKSTLNLSHKACAVTLHLVPIYAAIYPDDQRRPYVEQAVINYMNKAKNFASLNTTEIRSCKKPLAKTGLK